MAGEARIRVKDSAIVVEEPGTGLAYALCGERAALKPAHLGSLFPATPEGRSLAEQRCLLLLAPGTPVEFVRRDA